MKTTKHPVIDGYKVCVVCGENKPVSEYSSLSGNKCGLRSMCKECARKKGKEYYLANRDEILRKHRDRQERMPEKEKAAKQRYYEEHKNEALKRSLESYYTTDYLEKKYLKRYKASLEKVLGKRDALLKKMEDADPNARQRILLNSYETAIQNWERKIAEAEELIASYEANKTKQEVAKEDAPTPQPNQKPFKQETNMTKERLIELMSSVPNHAQIIIVCNTGEKASLAAVWADANGDTIIRNFTGDMSYICAEGTLFKLVSGGLTKGGGKTNKLKEGKE